MILAFELSMPNVGSWNGRWTEANRSYVRTRTFKGKKNIEKAENLIGRYYYNFGDGWGTAINVKQVDSKDAAKLRRKTAGFCGYDWMIDSIIERGKITTD